MKLRIVFIIFVSLAVGLAGAGISLLLPNQYTARGLLVITRQADIPSPNFFTYEGSYAQQNAGNYTGTFLAILQSPANLASADSGMEVKKLDRLVKAKREGSQAIAVSVKGRSPQEAQHLWTQITNSAINAHSELKTVADPLILITKTPGSPVIVPTYPQWQTVLGASFACCGVILSTLIILVRYLKEEHDY